MGLNLSMVLYGYPQKIGQIALDHEGTRRIAHGERARHAEVIDHAVSGRPRAAFDHQMLKIIEALGIHATATRHVPGAVIEHALHHIDGRAYAIDVEPTGGPDRNAPRVDLRAAADRECPDGVDSAIDRELAGRHAERALVQHLERDVIGGRRANRTGMLNVGKIGCARRRTARPIAAVLPRPIARRPAQHIGEGALCGRQAQQRHGHADTPALRSFSIHITHYAHRFPPVSLTTVTSLRLTYRSYPPRQPRRRLHRSLGRRP